MNGDKLIEMIKTENEALDKLRPKWNAEFTGIIENLNNNMDNLISKFIADQLKEKEKIIKAAAELGHKYLLFKTETNYDFKNSKTTMKFKYHDIDVMSPEIITGFEKQGFETYDLETVREYLKNNPTD